MAWNSKIPAYPGAVVSAITNMAVELAADYLEDKFVGKNKRRRPFQAERERKRTSTHSSSSSSSVVPLTTGVFESINWGANAFRNVARFSAQFQRAKREAIANGIAINEPIKIVDWDYGTIWSAYLTDPGNVWTFDSAQGQCRWYAFPSISPTDYDRAYAHAWGNDSSVDASHLTKIECYNNTLEFKNEGDRECEVDVWACYPREDIPIVGAATGRVKVPGDILYNGVDNNQFGPRLLISDQEPWQPTPAGLADSEGTLYDFTPFQCPAWAEMFNMRVVYHRRMGPGDSTRAHFGIPNPIMLDPADNLTGDGAVNPTQQVWLYKREMGPIFLMRVRGTLIHGENTPAGSEMKLGDGSTYPAGVGTANKPVVNYSNFMVTYAWRSEMYCRQLGSASSVLPQLGYVTGVRPIDDARIFTSANEFARMTNVPGDYAFDS